MTRAPAHLTVIDVQVVFKAMSLNAILQASSELADISKFRFWEDEQGAVKGIEKTDGRPTLWCKTQDALSGTAEQGPEAPLNNQCY